MLLKIILLLACLATIGDITLNGKVNSRCKTMEVLKSGPYALRSIKSRTDVNHDKRLITNYNTVVNQIEKERWTRVNNKLNCNGNIQKRGNSGLYK